MTDTADPQPREAPEEQLVRAFLKQIGLDSKKVPEAPAEGERRCDIRAWAEHELHWIEVKSRMDDDALHDELLSKEVVMRQRPMGYAGRVAEIFDDAVKQLDTLAAKEDGFEIAWLFVRSNPADAEIHFDQAIATAFGTEDILDLGAADGKLRPCYFFSESAFFKHKQLDAAVIFGLDFRFVLCVNPHARRAARFRETRFFSYFRALAEKDGVRSIIDPAQEEKIGHGYIADCSISRAQKEGVLGYVQKKYGLKNPRNIVMVHHAGYSAVPRR